MKKKFILGICAILCFAVCLGQSAPKPIDFEHKTWNFGQFREDGGNVNHTFKFVNKTKQPIVIERVEVNCGCTTTDFSRKPVMAGQSGHVTVTFDPMNRPGAFTKTITVTANNRSLQTILTIEGTVTPRVKSVDELYPIALGGGVRIDTRSAYFRYVYQGDAQSVVVGLINTSSDAVTLDLKAEPSYKQLKISAPKTVCAGCRKDITVTMDMTGETALYGVFSSSIYVYINGKRQPEPISAMAYGVDNFGKTPDIDKAPRTRFDRQFHDFGDVKQTGQPPTATFILTNNGAAPLIVRNISFGRGLSADLRAGTTVSAGKSVSFKVKLDPAAFSKGTVSESIMVILNDPLRPVRELRVGAIITQ